MGPLKSWSVPRAPPGKLFAPTLPALVPLLRRDRALDLTDAQTEQLVRMSAAVIDCGLANTTIYGLDDRYRGISNARNVVLVNPQDLAALGFADRELVDVISVFNGDERRAESFRVVAYPTARACAAAYYPEASVLVHKELVARESNTPGYKAVTIRFEKHGAG